MGKDKSRDVMMDHHSEIFIEERVVILVYANNVFLFVGDDTLSMPYLLVQAHRVVLTLSFHSLEGVPKISTSMEARRKSSFICSSSAMLNPKLEGHMLGSHTHSTAQIYKESQLKGRTQLKIKLSRTPPKISTVKGSARIRRTLSRFFFASFTRGMCLWQLNLGKNEVLWHINSSKVQEVRYLGFHSDQQWKSHANLTKMYWFNCVQFWCMVETSKHACGSDCLRIKNPKDSKNQIAHSGKQAKIMVEHLGAEGAHTVNLPRNCRAIRSGTGFLDHFTGKMEILGNNFQIHMLFGTLDDDKHGWKIWNQTTKAIKIC